MPYRCDAKSKANYIEDNLFDSIKEDNGEIVNFNWKEWYHFGVPDDVGAERSAAISFLIALRHCPICTSMDACYFSQNNLPEIPQHERCDCEIKSIALSTVKSSAKATCDIRKFTEYIFNKSNPQNNGKYEMFTKWGYDVADSQYLSDEMCKLALSEYLKGNYTIKQLTSYGPLLKITINLGDRILGTGWRLLPKGHIINTTPFAADR